MNIEELAHHHPSAAGVPTRSMVAVCWVFESAGDLARLRAALEQLDTSQRLGHTRYKHVYIVPVDCERQQVETVLPTAFRDLETTIYLPNGNESSVLETRSVMQRVTSHAFLFTSFTARAVHMTPRLMLTAAQAHTAAENRGCPLVVPGILFHPASTSRRPTGPSVQDVWHEKTLATWMLAAQYDAWGDGWYGSAHLATGDAALIVANRVGQVDDATKRIIPVARLEDRPRQALADPQTSLWRVLLEREERLYDHSKKQLGFIISFITSAFALGAYLLPCLLVGAFVGELMSDASASTIAKRPGPQAMLLSLTVVLFLWFGVGMRQSARAAVGRVYPASKRVHVNVTPLVAWIPLRVMWALWYVCYYAGRILSDSWKALSQV